MPDIHNGIEYITGTHATLGIYHLIIVDRVRNPNLRVMLRHRATPTKVHDMMKAENALIATEGMYWHQNGAQVWPIGDLKVGALHLRDHLPLKRYYFGITTYHDYLVDWLDVIGKQPGAKMRYGLKDSTITKHRIEYAFGGVVALIKQFRPIERKSMGQFTKKGSYVIDVSQDRVAYGWNAGYKQFLIVANGANTSWTVEQTRDFFRFVVPSLKPGYRISGAVMPDCGSYSYLMNWTDRTKDPVKINTGAGPTGVQPDRYFNISFLIVKEVP